MIFILICLFLCMYFFFFFFFNDTATTEIYTLSYTTLFRSGRINSVINVAVNAKGGPIPLLEQTILYNLGIPIHYYARVDFDAFRSIVDTLGGIDVPVTCDFQDWRLKDPSLDEQVEDNWELYT